MTPVVDKIFIYPVKSLDRVAIDEALLGSGGTLLHDREFAILDADGNFINGKRTAQVHLLRSSVDFDAETISLRHQQHAEEKIFHLHRERPLINRWLTDFFEYPVALHQNLDGQFLDIPELSGITVLSRASLDETAKWHGITIDEAGKRFRANVEIVGVPAFWEDQLFGSEGTAVEFKIGEAKLYGMSPRARCVVPTRHPVSGETTRGFQKTFSAHREESLPIGSRLSEFGHYYHLSVDVLIPPSEFGKCIRTGDTVEIIGTLSVNQE